MRRDLAALGRRPDCREPCGEVLRVGLAITMGTLATFDGPWRRSEALANRAFGQKEERKRFVGDGSSPQMRVAAFSERLVEFGSGNDLPILQHCVFERVAARLDDVGTA